MANNENLKSIGDLTKTKQREITRKGGIASVKSRRHKKKLAERISLALSISTQQNLNGIKKQIKESLKDRHTVEGRAVLKVLLAQAKTIQECGIDVYNMIKIAETSLEDEKKIKAINSLWDREEGKPLAKSENKEVQEFGDEVEYLD